MFLELTSLSDASVRNCDDSTVVPGFRVLGFSVLPGFRALNPGDGAWSVHKTLFGFKAPLSKLLIENFLTIFSFLLEF